MAKKYRVLIMGASYGSLLATKLGLAGHSSHLICLPAEADLINAEGAIVRMPVKGRDGLVEVNSRDLPGTLTAGGPAGVNPSDFDLVVLAMQEPQYRSARRAGVAGRGGEVAGAVHVHHEHAAVGVPQAHPGRSTPPRSAIATPTPRYGIVSIPRRSRCAAPTRRRSGRPRTRSTCCRCGCPPTSNRRVRFGRGYRDPARSCRRISKRPSSRLAGRASNCR